MSDWVIDIPDTDIESDATMYYPDERHDPMPVEPIVRCRDCKHWREVVMADRSTGHRCSGAMAFVQASGDGYCAWAVRREP